MAPFCGAFTSAEAVPIYLPLDCGISNDRRSLVAMQSTNLPRDAHTLFERGDIWAFQALVAMLREDEHKIPSEFSQDGYIENGEFAKTFSYVVRSLPAIGKLPWMASDTDLLFRIVEGFRDRDPISRNQIFINWEIVEGQLECADFEPCLEFRTKPEYRKHREQIANPAFHQLTSHNRRHPDWEFEKKETSADYIPDVEQIVVEGKGEKYNYGKERASIFLTLAREYNFPRYAWETFLGTSTEEIEYWDRMGGSCNEPDVSSCVFLLKHLIGFFSDPSFQEFLIYKDPENWSVKEVLHASLPAFPDIPIWKVILDHGSFKLRDGIGSLFDMEAEKARNES